MVEVNRARLELGFGLALSGIPFAPEATLLFEALGIHFPRMCRFCPWQLPADEDPAERAFGHDALQFLGMWSREREGAGGAVADLCVERNFR